MFEVLRIVRASIAKEQNVPAFVILHDSIYKKTIDKYNAVAKMTLLLSK